MRQVDIAITGSGSFSTEVLHALARQTTDVLDVALLARDADRLYQLSRSAAEIAASVGGSLRVEPLVINWSDYGFLSRTIRDLRPKVFVHAASFQSPWTLDGSDRWSTLIRSAGFGLTLPLQAALAVKVARAIADESLATTLVNACYPDAVNWILSVNGLPVSAGLGNVAILAASLWDGLEPGLKEGKQLRMIGHHAQMASITYGRPVEPPLKAWIDDRPIHDIAAHWFSKTHLPRNMNDVAGAAAVPMLLALSGRGPAWSGHAPGPLGLPGGYPVIARTGKIELDLPDQITLDEAKALNLAAGLADGVALKENGEVELPEPFRQALNEQFPDYAPAWHASEVEKRAVRLLALRESLSGHA